MSPLASGVQTLSIACCLVLVISVLPGIYSAELFPWHPVLVGVGILGFMSEGIVGAYRLRPLDGVPRTAALQQHMNIQIASGACVLAGVGVIYANKVSDRMIFQKRFIKPSDRRSKRELKRA